MVIDHLLDLLPELGGSSGESGLRDEHDDALVKALQSYGTKDLEQISMKIVVEAEEQAYARNKIVRPGYAYYMEDQEAQGVPHPPSEGSGSAPDSESPVWLRDAVQGITAWPTTSLVFAWRAVPGPAAPSAKVTMIFLTPGLDGKGARVLLLSVDMGFQAGRAKIRRFAVIGR